MSLDEKQSFLARWSRRKLESAREAVAPTSAVPSPSGGAPAPGGAASAPPVPKPELASIDSLHGLASEYRDFLHPDVDEKLRRFALKKLFHDPHFNVMDGLDTYIDDYSKPDPIPAEMLEGLKRANRALFPEETVSAESPGESELAPNAAPGAGNERGAQVATGAEAPAPPPEAEDKT
ncbi:MAG: DUF3306 domain-containing protein [Burkholderiales bacterium]